MRKTERKRKSRTWYRPWRWFSSGGGGSGLLEESLEASAEHAAMEAALDIESDGQPATSVQLADGNGNPIGGRVSHAGSGRGSKPNPIPPKSALGRSLAAPPRSKALGLASPVPITERTIDPSNLDAGKNLPSGSEQDEVSVVGSSRAMPPPPRAAAAQRPSPKARPGSRPVQVHAKLRVDEGPAPKVKDGWGLDTLSATIAEASSRDQIAREIIAYVAKHFRRVGVFTVRQDQAVGWMGAGPGFFPERLAKTTVPLGTASLFSRLADDPNVYIGMVEDTPEITELYGFLGGSPPPAVLMVPVMVRERLVAILYADNDSEPLVWVDVAVWKRIAEMMSIAFEIMILKNRMRS